MPTDPHAVEGVTLDEDKLDRLERCGYASVYADELFAQARAAIRLAAEVERMTNEHAAERDVVGRLIAETKAGFTAERDALRTQLAVAEARVAELTRVVANYAKQPHRPDCETFRVFGDPCGSVSAWVDPMTGRPTSETRSRPWRCFCGKAEAEAALAPPPPSEGATLLRADDAGGTDAGRR